MAYSKSNTLTSNVLTLSSSDAGSGSNFCSPKSNVWIGASSGGFVVEVPGRALSPVGQSRYDGIGFSIMLVRQ